MPYDQNVLRKKHAAKITEITDATSRFSFKVECLCGVQGLFYTKKDAEDYRYLHLTRQGIINAESIA